MFFLFQRYSCRVFIVKSEIYEEYFFNKIRYVIITTFVMPTINTIHMKKIFLVALILSLGGGTMFFFLASSEKETYNEYRNRAIKDYYRNYALPIPDYLEFAGEIVPINRLDVRESLDRELLVNTYWHSQTFLFFKRAHRYFPVIEPILEAQNIHDDFKYLALIESGLANVVSPAGASGVWQFMRATGQEYGLTINNEIDERYHLEKATVAACQYLHHAYKLFGNWTLAAAAYNMGNSGLRNQLNRQKVSSYYDLWLNQETARYMYRILAVKTIFENPKQYGFYFSEADLYPPVRTHSIDIDSSITNLSDFALEHDINLKILRTYNPWLRSNSLTNRTGKTYTLKIPYPEDLIYTNHFPTTDLPVE